MFSNYVHFQRFVLRAPKRPLQFIFELLEQERPVWSELIHDVSFKEALFLASPELIKAVENYQNLASDKKFRLEITLLKYLVRVATRCTPFGLFSGCSIGRISSQTQVQNLKGIIRNTSLDMSVLIEISNKLVNIDEIKLATKFFPNNSWYQIGNNYRYIAYYFENQHKRYKLENVQQNYYLKKVLEFSIGGKKVSEIYDFICDLSQTKDDNLSIIDIENFIDELIDDQLLISEISPSMAGGDYLKKLINHLEKNESKHTFEKNLKNIQASLVTLDFHEANTMDDYEQIAKEINKLGISEKHPYYFQTDHFQEFEYNTLSKKIPKKILKGIEVISRISSPIEKDYLERFRNAFIQRYGSREVSLSQLFDEEVGLKFQNGKMYTEFDLIADFQIKESWDRNPLKINRDVVAFLQSKYEQVLSEGLKSLEITDFDIKKLPDNIQKPLSNTFSALVELYQDHNKELIFFSSAGGSTALNLISRFSQQSKEMASVVNEVVEKELAYEPVKILAEINHLPDNRTGNILKSMVNRAYEIVYLSNSELPYENQIFINDLYVSIQNDRIRLRSKKLNKEIIPVLSNAHNFDTVDALPIYSFLCELQFQDNKKAFYFLWPELFLNFKFLPRVQYKDLIFSKAQWKLMFNEIENLKNLKDWRTKRKIPQFVQIQEQDKFLLLNLENEYCIELLKSHSRKYQEIWIIEFLFTRGNGLQINNQGYANEFIISYYKKNNEAA